MLMKVLRNIPSVTEKQRKWPHLYGVVYDTRHTYIYVHARVVTITHCEYTIYILERRRHTIFADGHWHT